MSRYKIQGGTEFEVPSAKEIADLVGAQERERARGIKPIRELHPVNATSWTSSPIKSGFAWSLRHIGCVFADAGLGDVNYNGAGSVTNPGTFTAIAATGNNVPAGLYNVTATVFLSGTVTAADANNMFIGGSNITAVHIAYPGIANVPVTLSTVVQATGGDTLRVINTAAASGGSAIYNASITATPVGGQGDSMLVVLGDVVPSVAGSAVAPIYVSQYNGIYQAADLSSEASLLNPGDTFTITGAAGAKILAAFYTAIEVPAEMVGKFVALRACAGTLRTRMSITGRVTTAGYPGADAAATGSGDGGTRRGDSRGAVGARPVRHL